MRRVMRVISLVLLGVLVGACASVRANVSSINAVGGQSVFIGNTFTVTVNSPNGNNFEASIYAEYGSISMGLDPNVRSFEFIRENRGIYMEVSPPGTGGGYTSVADSFPSLMYTAPFDRTSDTVYVRVGNRFTSNTIQIPVVISQPQFVLNDPPVNRVPSAQSVEVGGQLLLNFGVDDPDIGVGFFDVRLSVVHGQLRLSADVSTYGDIVVVDNNNSLPVGSAGKSIYIKAPASRILNYLTSVRYFAPASPVEDVITMLTNDRGNNGSDGQKTDTKTVNISVYPPPTAFAPPPVSESRPVFTAPLSINVVTINCIDAIQCTGMITASGGRTPYTFSSVSAPVPINGVVSINSNGSYDFPMSEVSGGSPFEWEISVTDANGNTSSAVFTVNVTPT